MNQFAETDKQFFEKHPELGGRKLSNKPEDKQYRQEYMQMLAQNKKAAGKKNKKAGNNKKKCDHGGRPDSNKDESEVKCKADFLSIKKDGNNYLLKIPGTDINYKGKLFSNVNFFQIVAGPPSKASIVHVKSEGLVGPCAESHKGLAFNYNKNDFYIQSKSDTEFVFKVHAAEFEEDLPLITFYNCIKSVFNRSDLTYQVDYGLCGFNDSVVVMAYPDLSASASIEFSYDWSFKKKGENLEFEKKENSSNNSIFDKLKYKFKVKYAGNEIVNISQDNKKEAKQDGVKEQKEFIESFNDGLGYLKRGLSVFFEDDQSLKVKIGMKISGTCELKEVKNTPFVDPAYKLNIGFDPLISMNAKADISKNALLAIPGVGYFLASAVKAAEAVDLAEVFLGFEISGEIKINGEFSRAAGGDLTESKLKSGGKITIDLIGRVASEHKIWRLKYSMGAKIGANSGVECQETELKEDESGPYFPLKVDFLGITLYYQTWRTVGISERTSETPLAAQAETSGAGTQEVNDVEELPEDHRVVLVEPYSLYNGNFYIFPISSADDSDNSTIKETDDVQKTNSNYSFDESVEGGGGRTGGGGASGGW